MYSRKLFNGSVALCTPYGRPNLNAKQFSNSATAHYFRTLCGRAVAWLRAESKSTVQTWVVSQFEHVFAQRLRRGQQAFHAYSRLWSENAVLDFLRRLRLQACRRGFALGALGMSAFDWNTNRIADGELEGRTVEFDYVEQLRLETLTCRICNRRRLVDTAVQGRSYCQCSSEVTARTLDEWSPFLEREDLVVWRRPRGSGYEYKLYGEYDDVSAEDFLHAQLDTEYRRRWDETAVDLRIVDVDPLVSNSQIVYWEMQWPRLFANRDYVFVRRHAVDHERGLLTVVSRSAEHPACPVRKDARRVQDYCSYLVVRPRDRLDRPGIEFSLTYYDDPGVNLPAAVTAWVAAAGMPDFLRRLRAAAREYSHHRQHQQQAQQQQQQVSNNSGYWHPHYYLG